MIHSHKHIISTACLPTLAFVLDYYDQKLKPFKKLLENNPGSRPSKGIKRMIKHYEDTIHYYDTNPLFAPYEAEHLKAKEAGKPFNFIKPQY